MDNYCIVQVADVAYVWPIGCVESGDIVLYTGDLRSCEYAYAAIEFDLSHYGRVLGYVERVA